MEKKFDLMTDSCCDLPYHFLQEEGVHYVNMLINIDGKEYVDDLGENFDYAAFIQKIKEGATPTTSQINIGTYLEIFAPFINASLPLLYFCFSSQLSGSYQNAVSALQQLQEEHGEEKVPIKVIDSKAACLGEGLLVERLITLRNDGKTIEEAIEWLEEYSPRLHSWVTVDDLKHLERGGRISKAQAAMGSLMNGKPIIMMNREGKLENVGKVRGRKKAIEKIVGETLSTIESPAGQIIYVAHAGDLEAAKTIQEKLQERLPAVKEIRILPMGPTIASHTGAGALAIFSFGKKR